MSPGCRASSVAVAGAALVLAIGVSALLTIPAGAHETSHGRLVFAEHDASFVRVLDLDSGKVTHSFQMPKPRPTLAVGGRYVLILTGDDKGTVRVLDSGLVVDTHGDHQDVEKRPVRLLKVAVTGDRPSHVASGYDWTSIFYDGPRPADRAGDAKAVFLDHKWLARDRTLTLTWTSAGPQHGIAVPLGRDLWAVTSANPAYAKQESEASSLPVGLQVIDAGQRWKKMAAFDASDDPAALCKDLHGHATDGRRHIFACKEAGGTNPERGAGLLVIEAAADGAWKARTLAYPDDRRVSTIRSRTGALVMVANYGRGRRYDALLRIAPDAMSLSAADVFAVPDGQAACQFDVTDDGHAINLLPDGTLRLYATSPAWKEVARVDAVAPFDCNFGASSPRPALELAGARAFVCDPAKRRIRAFDARSLKVDRDFPVNGVPEALAAPDGAQ
jgi:hypothetical protein